MNNSMLIKSHLRVNGNPPNLLLLTLVDGNYSSNNSFITSENNMSDNVEFCKPLESLPLIITAGLVSLAIIVGNCLVIQAIVCGNSRFFRPMYWFIIHLSVSDLCIGCMMMWNYCLAALFGIQNTLESLLVIQGIWVTTASASVFGILLLAIDRYMQVVHRRHHRKYFNHVSVSSVIFFTWIMPIMIFLVMPLVSGWSCQDHCKCHDDRYMECLPITDCSQIIPPFTKSYILVVILYVYIMLPLPVVIYGLIFIKARRSHQQATGHRVRLRDIRLIRTLAVIVLIYIVTLLPCGVILIIDYAIDYHSTRLTDYAIYVFVLGSLNSLANPILYIWRIPAIQVSLQRNWKCCLSSNHDARTSRKSKTSRTSYAQSADNFGSDPPSFDPQDHSNNRAPRFFFCGKSAFTSDISNNSTPLSQRSDERQRFKKSRHGNAINSQRPGERKKAKKPRKRPIELKPIIDQRHRKPPPPSPLCANAGFQLLQMDGHRQILRSNRISVTSSNEEKHEERAIILHRSSDNAEAEETES